MADSLEGMEKLVEALGKSKSKSKKDDAKLHEILAEVSVVNEDSPMRSCAVCTVLPLYEVRTGRFHMDEVALEGVRRLLCVPSHPCSIIVSSL